MTLRFLLFAFLAIQFYGIAQIKKNSDTFTYIDSLYNVSYEGINKEDYKNKHRFLKESINISYISKELEAYKSLSWYFGYKNLRDLDSTLYYFNRFESRLKEIQSSMRTKDSINNKTISSYYLNKGNLLSNCFGLHEQGLQSFYKAYPFISKDDLNQRTVYYIYVSQISSYKKQYDKSIEILNPILKDTASLQTRIKLFLLQTLALNYKSKKEFSKSLRINEKILELAEEKDDEYYIWWTKNEMVYDYYLMGDVKKAIDSALEIRSYYKTNIDEDALFNNSIYLGDFYESIGEIDKAIFYKKDALNYKYTTVEIPEIYRSLINYYLQKKKYSSVLNFIEKKDLLIDSIRSKEQSLYVNYSNAFVKLAEEEKRKRDIIAENKLLNEKIKKQTLCILIVIISLMGIYLFKLYKKGKKEIKTLKSNEELLLEKQLLFKENLIEASEIAIQKNSKILSNLKNALDEVHNINEIDKLFKFKQKINELLLATKSDLSDIKEKNNNSEHFSIKEKLKNQYPILSKTEIEYCVLTQLNLSIKEMAKILNVSSNTVSVSKSKIKNKLNIGKEISLKEFLDKLP